MNLDKLRRIVFFSILAVLAAAVIALYLKTLPLLAPGPDYLGQILSYLQSEGFNILWQTEGSGPMIRMIPILLAVLWGLYALQRLVLDRYRFYLMWTNLAWMLLTTGALIWQIILASAAQHYNWYWNPALGAPGEGDDVTHFFSGFAIVASLYNFNYFDLFKLKGRLGRFAEAAFAGGITLLSAAWFEFNEALHPEQYLSFPWDMNKDFAMAFLAVFVAATLYYFIVKFEE